MTILNIMLGRGKGGIEQAVLDYAEALLHAGIPQLTITQPGAAINAGIAKAHIPHATLRSLGAWDPVCPLRLRTLIKRERATAIIAIGNRAINTAVKASAGRIPVIAVAQNYKTKRYNNANAVFATTNDLAIHLKQQGFPAERIYAMPNVVRLPKVPARSAFRKPPVIGSMGRFVAKKGFEVFIDAAGLLQARGVRFRCILGGDGELRDEYKAKIARMGLTSLIEIRPWIEDKNAFFDELDIFVLPSHHEPFGIVLIEAQARGVPVISTMSEGPREIIEPGETGLLSPLASADALADAIEHALSDAAASLARAAAARAKVEREYSIDAMAVRLQSYLAAIAQPPISTP